MILSRFEIDDQPCNGRRNTEYGSSDCNNGSAIYHQTLTRASKFATGKIEYQPVGVLARAHLGSHQLTERNFHLDIVTAFRDRYRCDYRRRIARPWISGLLGYSGRRT